MADSTWQSDELPPDDRVTPLGWVRVALRAPLLAAVLIGGLGFLLVLRLVEKPFHGVQRPWTPHITVWVCRASLWIMGIGYRARGRRMDWPGAVVANHSSWLDIFALNAGDRVYFVSKSEVADWPGIGWLAKATGTVFIRRAARDAAEQKLVFEERLVAGHKLLFFPEGTSSDGLRVLPFKPTLFAAFFSDALRGLMYVQPVTVRYHAPAGADVRFFGWWGDMDFGTHLLKMLAAGRRGSVEVIWHEPLKVDDFADRKALARACERVVQAAHECAD